MQALFHLPPFINELKHHNLLNKIEFLTQMHSFYTSLLGEGILNENATKNFIIKCQILNIFQINRINEHGFTQQQDSSEFLMKLLNILNTEIFKFWNKIPPKNAEGNDIKYEDSSVVTNKTSFHKLYNLSLIYQHYCSAGHKIVTQISDCSSIDLHFNSNKNYIADIDSLIVDWLQEEKLEKVCNKISCKAIVMNKRCLINNPPKILIITLNRWKQNNKGGKNANISKDDSICNLKKNLNLDNLYGGTNLGVYNLCAIICHFGLTIDSGHYVSYCKEIDNNWFKYDDLNTKAKLVSLDEEETYRNCSSSGYIFFYELNDRFTELINNTQLIPESLKDLHKTENILVDDINHLSFNTSEKIRRNEIVIEKESVFKYDLNDQFLHEKNLTENCNSDDD